MPITTYEHDYQISVKAPVLPSTYSWTFTPYKRTANKTTQMDATESATLFVGADVNVTYASPVGPSPWVFTSATEVEGSDVQLVVGDSRLYAHRAILSANSTVFNAMFNGEYKEKSAIEVPVVVDGIEARHVETFLQCLYTRGSPPYAYCFHELVTLANYYDVKPLMKKCLELANSSPDITNTEKLLFAVRADAVELEHKIIESLTADDFREMLRSGSDGQLDEDRLRKVLRKCEKLLP